MPISGHLLSARHISCTKTCFARHYGFLCKGFFYCRGYYRDYILLLSVKETFVTTADCSRRSVKGSVRYLIYVLVKNSRAVGNTVPASK